MRRVFRCAATPLCRPFTTTASCAGPKQPPLKDTPSSQAEALSDLAAQLRHLGQGLALVGAQARKLEKQNADIKDMKDTLCELKNLLQQRIIEPEEKYDLDAWFAEAQQSLAQQSFGLHQKAEASCAPATDKEAKTRDVLLAPLTIDTTTPQSDVELEDPHTAAKKADDGWVTFRASQPLSETNHRWAVRVHEVGSEMDIMLGLLPKLSADREADMGGKAIDDLDGWCIHQDECDDSFVRGNWECTELSFADGDLVLFDYSFRYKTLNIRCGDKQVMGQIPDAGKKLYPAFSFRKKGAKVSFEKYPE